MGKELVGLEAPQNNYSIYIHINKINKKVYVGQTNQKPQNRWGKNGSGYKKQNFYKAIQKYGWNNFEHIILKTDLSQQEANLEEQKFIALYDSYNNGYNETLGGKNRKLSNKEKIKISQFMKEKQQGKNNSMAIGVICLNTKQFFNTLQQAADWCNGYPNNISNCCKGKYKFSGEHPITKEPLYWIYQKDYSKEKQEEFDNQKNLLYKRKSSKIKAVQQIDLKTNEILNEFENCTIAAEIVLQDKRKYKGISRCATGERNSAYGYKWRYKA